MVFCQISLFRHIAYLAKVKPTSQYYVNHSVTSRFLPDAYFSRSAAHQPIFLTFNHVVKSASWCLTAAAGRLFGHLSISSGNDQIFGRFPTDVPPMIVRRLSGDHWGSCRSLADDNESCDHRQVTVWWAFGHWRVRSGFNFEIDFSFSHVYNNCY